MNNILRQYDWNNHKALSKKELGKLFIELSLSDKIKIYKHLKPMRRQLVKKEWEAKRIREKEIKLKELIEISSELIFEDVYDTEIKSEEEALLTIGIILFDKEDFQVPDEPSSNYGTEEESFHKSLDKTYALIHKMFYRKYNEIPDEKVAFMDELYNFEYVPPLTENELWENRRKKWHLLYQAIGMGVNRADIITRALKKQIIIIGGCDMFCDDDICDIVEKWEDKIDVDTHNKALELFTLVNNTCDELLLEKEVEEFKKEQELQKNKVQTSNRMKEDYLRYTRKVIGIRR